MPSDPAETVLPADYVAEFRCLLCGGTGPWWYLIRHTRYCSSPDPQWTCVTESVDALEDTAVVENNARQVVVNTETQGVKTLWLNEGERVCQFCKGAGRWDSCFDCGNRGYNGTYGKTYPRRTDG